MFWHLNGDTIRLWTAIVKKLRNEGKRLAQGKTMESATFIYRILMCKGHRCKHTQPKFMTRTWTSYKTVSRLSFDEILPKIVTPYMCAKLVFQWLIYYICYFKRHVRTLMYEPFKVYKAVSYCGISCYLLFVNQTKNR